MRKVRCRSQSERSAQSNDQRRERGGAEGAEQAPRVTRAARGLGRGGRDRKRDRHVFIALANRGRPRSTSRPKAGITRGASA
jgi:hypothetical protein